MPVQVNENMSLDEIIAASKKALKKGAGGKFQKVRPAKQLGRPAFADKRPGARPNSTWPQVADRFPANPFVTVSIGNLAHTVKTADLQELFTSYNPSRVNVHYDDIGRSLFTADVHLRLRDAQKLVNDFKGVALDGRPFKMAIVDPRPPHAVHPRPNAPPQANTATLQKQIAVLARKVQTMEKQRSGAGSVHKKGKAVGGKVKAEKKPLKTPEELDLELEAYMRKPKHNEIVF